MSLVKWLKILWENWRAGVRYVVLSLLCLVSSVLSPAAGEFVFLL
jgi:hypothetical protein